MNIIKQQWWLLLGGGGVSFDFAGASPITGARGFRVQYRTSDFAYQTDNPAWTDTSTPGIFKSGANVIDVQTVLTNDTTKACAGVGYFQSPSGVDLIVFGESGSGGSEEAIFFNRSFVEQFRTSNARQGCNIDSINSYIYSWLVSTNRIQIKDFSNNTIETLSIGTSLAQGMMAYNQYTGDLYLAPETAAGLVERWKKVGADSQGIGGSWVLQQTLWFTSIDQIGFDFLFNRIVTSPGSGSNNIHRYQHPDGVSRIKIRNVPINTLTNEGVVIDPNDGTLWIADPSGYNLHGSIVGGNRGWHLDPEALYLKYINFPHMVPLSKFKHNGTITGQLNQQEITGATSVMYPVLNFTGFTNQQNASAWQDMDGTELQGLEFRGSNTAPTTSPTTPIACDVAYYDANGTNDGWGATVPGAWQSTPPSLDFVQARVAEAQPDPVDEITITELIAGLNGKCKILIAAYDDQLLYVYPMDSNRVYLGVNQLGDADTNFFYATSSSLPVYQAGTPGNIADLVNNNNFRLQALTDISSDQAGQIVVVGKRNATTTRAIYFAMNQVASNVHQLQFLHKASTDTPASEIGITHVGATVTAGAFIVGQGYIIVSVGTTDFTLIGAASNTIGVFFNATGDGTGTGTANSVDRIGIADTSSTYKRLDYISTGSVWKIKINGVDQTLNVSLGSNTGAWFGDLTSPTRGNIGLVEALTLIPGQELFRLWIYCNAELDSTESALVDSFITQENLLA